MSSEKGCWTCKDRKISCDRSVPACIKCSKSKRACGGYGIRLSWPQHRQAPLESTILHQTHGICQQQNVQWVNVGLIDIRLHLVATNGDGRARGRIKRENLAIPNITGTLPTARAVVAAGNIELLCYCAIGPEIDAVAAIEHIAAGIILCVVEMQQKPDRDSGWVGHICGAKEVIHAVKQMEHTPGSDASVILSWVYYFDTLSRFSLRHWRTESITSTALELGFNANGSQLCTMQYIIARNSLAREIPILSIHAHHMLRLLVEVFETILYTSDPRYHATEYQQSLDDLRSKLAMANSISREEETIQDDFHRVELIRLASLVYLERVSRNFSGQSAQLELWTKAAQSILATLDVCPCPFTLFVFGCEAHTDEDRMTFLDLFTRIESKPHLKSLFEVKGLIQSAWIQHDLEVDGTLEYIHKLNLVLSSREVVPSFM